MGLFNKAKADAAGFYAAATAAAVQEGTMTTVKVAGQRLILTRQQGKALAFSALCPHAAADLSKGQLRNGRVTCPEHGYKFDVCNGRILYPSDENYRLKRYEVKEEDGQVWVKV